MSIKRSLALTALLVLVLLTAWIVNLNVPKQQPYFAARTGTPDAVKQTTKQQDGVISELLEVTSTTGLTVRFRVLRPAAATRPLPLLVVVGGHRTGKDAVDLVGTPTDMAYIAIDYPYAGQHRLKGLGRWLRTLPLIQQAFLDTPPALSLALSWALQQPWVDADSAELVGVSLGVPFAATAAAVDDRFSRLWLLHGGVDNRSWVAHAGREHIDNDTLRAMVAGAALTFVYGPTFDTRERIAQIAPRPIVFVAACSDDYVPRESVESLLSGPSSAHLQIVWTSGLHINPKRPHELLQLLNIVTSRVAGRPPPPAVSCDASAGDDARAGTG